MLKLPAEIITSISRFDGGISDDIREVALNKFGISKNFDIFTSPKKLIPYPSTVDDSAASSAIGALLFSSGGELVGLGTSSGNVCLWFKTDPVSGAWASNRTAWKGAAGNVTYNLFIEFTNGTAKTIYWCQGTSLSKALVADPWTLSETFTTGALSGAPTGQGLVHIKANKLFIPVGNKIDTVNSSGTLALNQAPLISSNLTITSLAEYGSYLAIGCRDLVGGESKVLIWDMVSTFIDQIPFGRDSLYVLNNLEGYLIGISSSPSTVFSTDQAKITIQSWAGGKPSLIKELLVEKAGGIPTAQIYPNINFVKDNKLYFAAKLYDTVNTHIGLWAIGRKNANYNFAVTLDRFATVDNSETSLISAIAIGNYFWFVHTANGTITMTKRGDFLATSIYESQKFNGGDSSLIKKLIGANIQTDKLPTDAVATLKYRCDGSVTWVTLITSSTVGSLYADAIGGNVPEYYEIEWQALSYKGANITGFSFVEEIISKRKYS
jgi:hypothetical protein